MTTTPSLVQQFCLFYRPLTALNRLIEPWAGWGDQWRYDRGRDREGHAASQGASFGERSPHIVNHNATSLPSGLSLSSGGPKLSFGRARASKGQRALVGRPAAAMPGAPPFFISAVVPRPQPWPPTGGCPEVPSSQCRRCGVRHGQGASATRPRLRGMPQTRGGPSAPSKRALPANEKQHCALVEAFVSTRERRAETSAGLEGFALHRERRSENGGG